MAKSILESTVEELRGKKKALIGVLSVIGGLFIVYVATLIYFQVNGKWTQTQSLAIVPLIGLVVASLPSIMNVRAIQAEIARRESQDRQ